MEIKKHGSLFTGLGGFDLAAEWMGWTNIFQVENNKWCIKNLTKNFPETKRYADIFDFDGKPFAGQIDILTGGFPCQTFSVAGKGAVDLTLWKEMYRCITDIKPPYVLAENVPGIVSRKRGMAFETICADLEIAGYQVQPLNIPIAGKGAPHERERIWFVAYSRCFAQGSTKKRFNNTRNKFSCQTEQQTSQGNGLTDEDSNIAYSNTQGLQKPGPKSKEQPVSTSIRTQYNNSNPSDLPGKRLQRRQQEAGGKQTPPGRFDRQHERQWQENWVEVAARLCRMDVRVPSRMDRIMALGNSASPILIFEIFKAIEQTNPSLNQAGK